jgi:hypothetical protein
LRKRVEDVEIIQMLEESTDSDVTIFSSEDDEDGNEPDSDEDGQLNDNSETNSSPKTPHLEWTNTLNFKELKKYENLSGPKHSLPAVSSKKDFFELFVTNPYSESLSLQHGTSSGCG